MLGDWRKCADDHIGRILRLLGSATNAEFRCAATKVANREFLMKSSRSSRVTVSVAALLLAGITSSPAAAQHEDITKRLAAMDACAADPNNLGYANYDICVEETYAASLRDPGSSPNPPPVQGNNDPFDPCAGTRIHLETCRG